MRRRTGRFTVDLIDDDNEYAGLIWIDTLNGDPGPAWVGPGGTGTISNPCKNLDQARAIAKTLGRQIR